MKICILTTSFPRFQGDYAGKPVYNLASGLAQRNNHVTVLAPHNYGLKSVEYMNGIKILRFRYGLFSTAEKVAYGEGMPVNLKNSLLAKLIFPLFCFCFLIKSLIHSKECDIIHAQWIFAGIFASIVKKLYRKPFILTVRHHQENIYPRRIYQCVLRSADKIISPHPNISRTIKNIGFTNVMEIPNIVRVKNISGNKISEFKNEFNLNGERLITFISRLEKFRDPLTFIQSIPLVLKNNNNVKFLIVGSGSLYPQIKNTITKLNLQKSVILTGIRTDINTILSLSTIFIAISPFENIWCNSLVEAMSLGIPSIVSGTEFSRKELIHLQNSYLVTPRDKVELAGAIINLMTNEILRKKLSQNARFAIQNAGFDNKSNIEKTIDIYKKMMLK